MPDRGLGQAQMERYHAQLALPDFGPRGQRRLLDSRVLLVGVGGLGCPAALYLAAAGVGSLTLVDDDIVELSNLQRQILYTEADLAQPKAEAAALRLRAANPEIRVDALDVRLTAANAGELVDGHDLVLDGSDNFATRYVVNDAAVLGGVPLISGSLYRYEGQLLVVRPPETACYRCLFRAAPPEAPPCHDAGILGAVAGIVGTLQAAEAINLLASGNSGLAGRLLLVNAKEMSMHTIEARPDPACPLCGSDPTIERPTAVAVCETG